MKRIVAFILCLMLCSGLAGCGEAGIPQADYDAVVSERDNLQSAYDAIASVSGSKEEIETEISRLQGALSDMETEIAERQTELDSITETISENQETLSKISNYEELIEQYEATESELSENIAVLETREGELNEIVSGLEAERDSLQTQVDHLGQVVLEHAGDPIKVPPGNYTFGSDADIPAGRYTVTGSSNFFVRNWNDKSVVNIILGGRIGVESYTFEASEGYTLQTEGGCTLTPVE